MTWITLLPWALAIVGCLAAFVIFRRARKLKKENQNLRAANQHYLRNMQILKESEVADARSQAALVTLTNKVKGATTDEEAILIRRDIVDSILGGLQNL